MNAGLPRPDLSERPYGKQADHSAVGRTGNSAGNVWRTIVWTTFESLDLTSSQQIAFDDDGVGTSSQTLRDPGGASASV